nr:MAG TPA: Mitochondrial and peroxisomal fission factor Mff [Caudoviricetes sp.]
MNAEEVYALLNKKIKKGGNLWFGASAGFCFLNCWAWLDWAYWYFLSAD